MTTLNLYPKKSQCVCKSVESNSKGNSWGDGGEAGRTHTDGQLTGWNSNCVIFESVEKHLAWQKGPCAWGWWPERPSSQGSQFRPQDSPLRLELSVLTGTLKRPLLQLHHCSCGRECFWQGQVQNPTAAPVPLFVSREVWMVWGTVFAKCTSQEKGPSCVLLFVRKSSWWSDSGVSKVGTHLESPTLTSHLRCRVGLFRITGAHLP